MTAKKLEEKKGAILAMKQYDSACWEHLESKFFFQTLNGWQSSMVQALTMAKGTVHRWTPSAETSLCMIGIARETKAPKVDIPLTYLAESWFLYSGWAYHGNHKCNSCGLHFQI